MVDKLQRFLDTMGLLQRMREEKDAMQNGTLFGQNLGQIPVLGGVLRPTIAVAHAAGLGLEGLSAIGGTVAGEAAIPAIAAQNRFGDPNNPITQYTQQLASQGYGNLAAHPRNTIAAMRHSPDRATSYLSGILEMASDPTNILLAGAGGFVNAGRAAEGAAMASAGAKISPELAQEVAGNAAKKAGQDFADNVPREVLGTPYLRPTTKADLADQLTAAAKKRMDAADELTRMKDFYGYARQGVKDELAAAKGRGDLFDLRALPKEERDVARGLNAEAQKSLTARVLEGYPGGPQQGQTWHDYIAEPRKALADALAQEDQIRTLYHRAGGYDLAGNPLDAAAELPKQPHINDLMNAGMDEAQQAIPVDNEAARLVGLDDAAPAGAPDSPEAIKQTMDDLGKVVKLGPDEAQQALTSATGRVPAMAGNNLVPEQVQGFRTRMSDMLSTALREGLTAQKAAMADPKVKVGFSDVASFWKGQMTQTLRNIFQDEIFTRIMAADRGIRQQTLNAYQGFVAQRLKEGEENPLMLLGHSSDILNAVGRGVVKGKEEIKYIMDGLGFNFFDMEADNMKQLSAMQSLVSGLGTAVANPLRATMQPLAVPLAYLAPMRQRMFHIINSVTHLSAKGAAFDQAFLPYLENSAQTLFRLAESEGKDVGALRGFGMVDNLGRTADGMLLHEGAFSPEAVKMVLGERYASEWENMVQGAIAAGFENATKVFGNYAKRGPLEQTINKFVPFMSWAWRAYPRVAQAVLAHPAVAVGTLHLYEAELQQAQEKQLPGYLATTVGINKDTPLLGVLAKVFSPDQEAEVRLNPLALFSPLPGEALSALTGGTQEEDPNKTGYQKAKDVAGIVGLGPNPLVQGAAYITGQDYQSPSPASRYSQIDQMFNDLGINSPVLPTIQAPLRGLRKMISGQQDTYDPVLAKAKELVYEDTGHPLNDVRNKMVAAEIASGDSDYLRRAERIVDVQGAGRQVFNATSPQSVSVRTNTTAARQAEGKPPFDYNDIQAVKQDSPVLAQLMQAQNDEWYRTHPAAAVGKNANVTPADMTILRGARRRAALAASMSVPR